MSNPAMPSLPGFGAIAETMELVRNMWGGMGTPGVGIPGMVMPTLSVEEINKQISDLKAVESWLTLNMNMLRGTIQALEVQSATISTLRTMGEKFSAAVKPAEPAPAPATGFSFPFGSAAPAEVKKPAAATPFATAPSPAPAPAAASAPAPTHVAPVDAAAAPTATGATAPLANPAAWWNMLQDQFKQAVSTALTPEADGGTRAAMSKSANPSAGSKDGGSAPQGKNEAAPRKPARSPARPATKSAAKSRAKAATKTPT